MEYADEPRRIFTPLSESDYCDFYVLEMEAFDDDAVFYSHRLHDNGNVLELGCGTGRLTRLLAGKCRHITGIDISAKMIDKALRTPLANVSYHQMDMTDMTDMTDVGMREISFDKCFDTIVIPYNTLNLLGDPKIILKCLALCRKHLSSSGNLLLQLYHPCPATVACRDKIFQFAIFDDGCDCKII